MKKIQILILTLFVTFNYIQSQECCLKQYLGEDYEIDVKHLALLRMEQFDVPQQEEVIIDQLWQDTIWEGLTAIFYSDSYGRDQVFDEYCLHHRHWNLDDFQRISQRMYVRPDPDCINRSNVCHQNRSNLCQSYRSKLCHFGGFVPEQRVPLFDLHRSNVCQK